MPVGAFSISRVYWPPPQIDACVSYRVIAPASFKGAGSAASSSRRSQHGAIKTPGPLKPRETPEPRNTTMYKNRRPERETGKRSWTTSEECGVAILYHYRISCRFSARTATYQLER
jgi:hypothetical protein